MRRLFFSCACLLLFFLHPATGQDKLPDSTDSEIIRRNAERVVRAWQDSMDRERLLQNVEKHGKSLDAFLAERREEEKKEKRRMWVRVGAGVIFLFALFVTIARRAKAKKRS